MDILLDKMDRSAQVVILAAASHALLRQRKAIHSADLVVALLTCEWFSASRFLDQETLSRIVTAVDASTVAECVVGAPVELFVFTDPVKRVLAYALEEAQNAGPGVIHPAHLLAGVLRDEWVVGTDVLRSAGLELSAVRGTFTGNQ